MCYTGLMVHEQPPSWVEKRATCRIDLIFEALSQILERDVDEFNSLLPNLRHQRTASVAQNGDGTHPLIRVYRAEENGSETILTFTLHGTTISIQTPGKEGAMLGVAWDTVTRSCLLVDKETEDRFKVWQVSERSLGPFLFG